MVLNGSSGINLGSPAALNGALCLIVAFQRNGGSGGWVLYGEGASGSQIDWCLFTNGSNQLGAILMFGGVGHVLFDPTTGVTLADNTPYIAALRYDSTTPASASFLVTGAAKQTYVAGANVSDNGSDTAHIGYDTYGDGTTPQEFFTGTIYQLAKLAIPPSDAAINALTPTGDWRSQMGCNLSDFAGWWRFNGDLLDSGPNGINGTAVGSLTFL